MQRLADYDPATDDPKPFKPSVIISFRIQHVWWLRLQEIMERSSTGYDTVGDYMRHLIRTQAFRQR